MNAKYAIIILHGAADQPLEELANRTPLQAARIPNMDSIAATGRIGSIRTVPPDFTTGGDVATLSLLGYDPTRCFTGRAPLEAVARNVMLSKEDVVFRCNLVTVFEQEMVDHAAGHIRPAEATQLIHALNKAFDPKQIRFHGGDSYRNLMVVRDPAFLESVCIAPESIHGDIVDRYLPTGPGAGRLRKIMQRALKVLERHEVNLVRRDLDELPANGIWLWGQGVTPIMRRFRQRFRVAGAAVGGVDLFKGLAKLIGWKWIHPPGATGDANTDYAGKARAAAGALDEFDLVAIHVEAPGDASLRGDVGMKVKALERIDEEIVAPLRNRLRAFGQWKMLVVIDYAASAASRCALDGEVPFCMAGTGVPHGLQQRFDETAAAKSDLHIERAWELMEYFLRP